MNNDDFIEEPIIKHEDRIIRSVYTPKEVVCHIKTNYELICTYWDLTYSEKALLREFCNSMIGWYVEHD